MKGVVLVASVFLIIAAAVVLGTDTTESQCPNTKYEQLTYNGQDAFNDILNCFPVLDSNGKVKCSLDKAYIHRCRRGTFLLLQHCTKGVSDYIPEFGVDVFDSLYTFLCKNEQKHFKELMDLQLDQNCVGSVSRSLRDCSPSKNVLEPIHNLKLPKKEFCQNAHDLTACIGRSISNHCSRKRYIIYSGAVDALLAPCDDSYNRTGVFTFGPTTTSTCSNRKHGPYDGECALDDMMKCLSMTYTNGNRECVTDRDYLNRCVYDISENLRPGTDSTSAYVPGLVTEIFESLHEYVCGNDLTRFKELDDLDDDGECMIALSAPLESCHPSKNAINAIRNLNVPKKDFCKNANDLAVCVGNAIRDHCSKKRHEFFAGLKDALLAPCSAELNTVETST